MASGGADQSPSIDKEETATYSSRFVTPDEIDQAVSGDTQALAQLFATLRPTVEEEVRRTLQTYALRRRRDARQDVADFAQATFLALLAEDGRVLRAWHPSKGRKLSSFVRLVTRRHVSTTMRTQRVNPWRYDDLENAPLENLDSGLSVSQLAETRQILEQTLPRVYARLSERGVLLFEMLFVHECTVGEAQDRFGLSRGAVYAARSRFRKIAREVLETIVE